MAPKAQSTANDLRPYEWHVRRATLASLLRKVGGGIRLSEHIDSADGEAVFRHACVMGLEGIVAKRRDRRACRQNNLISHSSRGRRVLELTNNQRGAGRTSREPFATLLLLNAVARADTRQDGVGPLTQIL